MRRRSRPRHHTSSGRGCSVRSPCSGTRPHHKSSGLEAAVEMEAEVWLSGAGDIASGHIDHQKKQQLMALLQLAGSSEPSTQSLSRSHTHTRGMQRLVMAHWNWVGAHVTSAAARSEEDVVTIIVIMRWYSTADPASTHGSPSHPRPRHSCPGRCSGRSPGCSDLGGSIWTG